jgi:hypothetical protein
MNEPVKENRSPDYIHPQMYINVVTSMGRKSFDSVLIFR